MWKYRQTNRNNDWLMHANGFKYVDKKMVNGHWVYTYPDEISRTSNTNGDPRLQRSQTGTVNVNAKAVNAGKAAKSTVKKLASAYKNGNKTAGLYQNLTVKETKKVERKPEITDKEDPNINKKSNDARATAMAKKDAANKDKAVRDAKEKAFRDANKRTSDATQRDARAKAMAKHQKSLDDSKNARAKAMADKNARDAQVRDQEKAEADKANRARARAMTAKNNRDSTERFKRNLETQKTNEARANAQANKSNQGSTKNASDTRSKAMAERQRKLERDRNIRYKKKK